MDTLEVVTPVSTLQSAPAPRITSELAITVLAGGPSSEREVSLTSGQAIADALSSLNHKVQIRDISPEDLSALDLDTDVIFPALHGQFGEDGELQKILEERKLRYVGCGPEASTIAINKAVTKRVCSRAGIPTAQWQQVVRQEHPAALQIWVGKRVVVKPVDQGSSVDTYIVPDAMPLNEAVSQLLAKYGQALVEQFIDGPELTVGVLGGQPLPVIEIVPKAVFYDYQAKYVAEDTQYIVNPPLPPEVLKQAQDLSLTVFNALGCRDLSRIDWRIEAATGKIYLLEVNTLPGFTSHSLLPKAAAAIGIGFADLCQQLVEMAMAR
jgi:D-alanine-D-alanine ligase